MPFIFEANNRGKRSFAVDLKQSAGVDLVRRLAAVLRCVRPIDAPRRGARAGSLPGRAGAGQPAADLRLLLRVRAARPKRSPTRCDGVVQAESGLALLQKRRPGQHEFRRQCSWVSLSQAVLIAVMKRERFGVVEPVDVSLLDTAVYMQSAPIVEFSTRRHAARSAFLWDSLTRSSVATTRRTGSSTWLRITSVTGSRSVRCWSVRTWSVTRASRDHTARVANVAATARPPPARVRGTI